jgi:hypothetical protein
MTIQLRRLYPLAFAEDGLNAGVAFTVAEDMVGAALGFEFASGKYATVVGAGCSAFFSSFVEVDRARLVDPTVRGTPRATRQEHASGLTGWASRYFRCPGQSFQAQPLAGIGETWAWACGFSSPMKTRERSRLSTARPLLLGQTRSGPSI